MSAPIIILGPQRPSPNLRSALDAANVQGKVAVITAGWRYDEFELRALQEELGGRGEHLPLYHWFDALGDLAPELRQAHRERQERIKAFKRLYKERLQLAYAAVLRVKNRPVEFDDLHRAEFDDAVAALRDLDQRVVEVSDAIRSEEPPIHRLAMQHAAVAAYREQIRRTIAESDAVAIAGGHVAILLNRMTFFGMEELLREAMHQGKAIVCWSAGAMALSERVVLFYDDPPEGPGEPEVLDRGLGLIRGRTFFPHAQRRLRLEDRDRLKLLQARFGSCYSLEVGAHLVFDDGAYEDRSKPDCCRLLVGDA